MAMLGSLKSAVFDREARKMQYRSHIRGLNAYDRHKKFMNDYGMLFHFLLLAVQCIKVLHVLIPSLVHVLGY
ncbi:hypothetical protein KSP40_PGU014684 [Platanthera guangdongensis]|uniref:Uncharacterized protein n=1 Tax=Platanthera guangdongensis TaxID=2320717 RepID=A0ABR2LCV1_9ASPA